MPSLPALNPEWWSPRPGAGACTWPMGRGEFKLCGSASKRRRSFLPSLLTQELAEPNHESSGLESLAGQPTPLLRGSAENP